MNLPRHSHSRSLSTGSGFFIIPQKQEDSEKPNLKLASELKGRELLWIRHMTHYNYSALGLGRLQKDEKIYFQFDGVHLEAPEQRFPVASQDIPKKK